MNSVEGQGSDVLLLDAGGAFWGNDEQARQRAETLIEGMSLMGYAALNLGDEELALGRAFLTELRQKADFPFLSANLVSRDGTELPWQAYLIAEISPLKVAVIGLISPQLWSQVSDGTLEARDPAAVLDELLPQVKKKAHFVIVLAHMHHEEAIGMLRTVEGINVMVVAHDGRFTSTPLQENGTLVVSGGEQGKYVGHLQIVADTSGQTVAHIGRIVTLGEETGEDPAMLELLARHGFD